MKILGISDGTTGGAAMLEDGRITYAIHEERLIRRKMAKGFPRQSIAQTLQDTGTSPDRVDAITIAGINEVFRDPAVAFNGWLMGEQAPVKELMLSAASTANRVLGARSILKKAYYALKATVGTARRRKLVSLLRREWGFQCPIRFIDHHFAHACTAYYTSGFSDATVVTMDGAGDSCCSQVYAVRDGRFEKLASVDSFDSIGNYYAYVTHLCGFKAQRHEGKITGLAAYGEPCYSDILGEFIGAENGRLVNRGGVFYWAAVRALEKALPRGFSAADLASSMQQVLERECCAFIKHWVERTGCPDVTLAGGVFANVKLNQRVHELECVRSVFVHPGMGDEGLPVGAALALAADSGEKENGSPGRLRSAPLENVYLGAGCGKKALEAAIQEAGLEAEHVPDMERRIAELLAAGNVVARFDGRMEYGPRALGNRSVLYQATDPTVNDWLNKRLRRTEFMPFAPVTLEEHAGKCYRNLEGGRYTAEFMTITFDCTEWMKEKCPAVVHVDGTARPQILSRAANPSYYRILDEYYRLTGLPSIINTSFNMHEEPIVCTPQDAIRAFRDGGLDYLALGSFLLERPEASSTEAGPATN